MRFSPSPTVLFCFYLVASVWVVAPQANSQPILSHQTISMGGGTATITGPAANFYNPANLMIRDNKRRNRLILGQGGFFVTDGMAVQNLNNNYADFEQYFLHFNPETTGPSGFGPESMSQRFPDSRDFYHNAARYDVLPIGISITRNQQAFSLAFRSRGLNSYEMNRGWYETTPQHSASGANLERVLRQNLHSYHEISLGFARELTMVNGWMPGLNKLYLGIAPKFIAGALFFEGDYTSSHYPGSNEGEYLHIKQYQARSGIDNTPLTPDAFAFNQTRSMNPGIQEKLEDHFETSGYGLGFDMGLTLIFNLGDDISLAPHTDEPLRKSLRFSLSMTDLGIISYDTHQLVIISDTTLVQELPSGSTQHFNGQIGEFPHFIGNHTEEWATQSGITQERRLNKVLPAAIHAGSAFQYNRLLATADLQYQINSNQFGERMWRASIGSELRLLKFLPLRTGFSLDSYMKPTLGLGIGIDTGLFEASIATQLKQGFDKDTYSVGLALTAIQIRF